jgi:hypothetical protein
MKPLAKVHSLSRPTGTVAATCKTREDNNPKKMKQFSGPNIYLEPVMKLFWQFILFHNTHTTSSGCTVQDSCRTYRTGRPYLPFSKKKDGYQSRIHQCSETTWQYVVNRSCSYVLYNTMANAVCIGPLHVHGAGRITQHSRTEHLRAELLAERSKFFIANLLSVV